MTAFGLNPHILEQIVSVLKRYPALQSASIFGSRARGDYKNYSDIDIALYGPDRNAADVMDISFALKQLPVIFKFDVVHVDQGQKPELIEKIGRDGKPIYSKVDD